MRKTLTCLAFVAVVSALATGQVVQLQPHEGATDVWGPYYNSHKKITFSGRVTGIVRGKQAWQPEGQFTLLVKNSNGGATAEVEVGPEWFVDDQQAKIHIGDKVQVTGAKTVVDDRGIVIASQVLLHGQGGPVLALRRPSGIAYWVPTEVAAKAQKSDSVAAKSDDSAAEADVPTEGNQMVQYPPSMLQFDGGRLNVDTNAWYGYQNAVTRIGNYLTVVSGPFPFFFFPH